MTVTIVGIDPGTAVGYAILSERGEVLKVGSGKGLSMGELITRIISVGRPMITGTDKGKAPSMVQALATKLGARLFHPQEDLLVTYKRDLVRTHSFDVKLNMHELDALASALHTFKNYKKSLEKMEDFIGSHPDADEFKIKALRNEDLDYENVLASIEQQHQRKEIEITLPRQRSESKPSDKTVTILEQDKALLEREVKKLRNALDHKNTLLRRVKKKVEGFGSDAIIRHKDERIKRIDSNLKAANDRIRKLEEEIKILNSFIGQSSKFIIVKKLKNLGREELDRKHFLHIREGDILLVDDYSIRSQAVLESIKDKISIIITSKPQRTNDGFIVLPPEGLIVKQIEHYALADKGMIDGALKKHDLIGEIVKQYRKERNQSTTYMPR